MKDQQVFDDWKRNIYPKYWSRVSRKLGLDAYCAGLLILVKRFSPCKVFELAVGNGFPFAENLVKERIDVSGCDISAQLIAELKESLPEVHAFVGGYADFNPAETGTFDLVYCFRSTWYFPDIAAAIDFMLKMAKPDGVVLFDIMNAGSEWNRRLIARKNLLFPVTILKNLTKFFLNMIWPRRWLIDTVFGVRELMYSRKSITDLLIARGLTFEVLNLLQIKKMGGGYSVSDDDASDQKLVFVITKR